PENGEPTLRVVERPSERGHESFRLRQRTREVRVVRVGAARALAVELEQKGRRRGLAGLREVTKAEARVARRQIAGKARKTGFQPRGGRRRTLALEGERGRRQRLVDPAALVVEEDRVLEIPARMPPLVEAREKDVGASREPALPDRRDVHPARAR